MAATGNSCFWLAYFFKSSPLKEYIYTSGCHLKLSVVFEISVQCCKMFVKMNKMSFVCVKLNMHVICFFVFFLYLYMALLFFKNKQMTKNDIHLFNFPLLTCCHRIASIYVNLYCFVIRYSQNARYYLIIFIAIIEVQNVL